jgi:hypothetical protein
VSSASTIMSTITSTITAVFCQCCNITPPSKKACPQALSVLCLWGILVFILNRQLIVFTILAFHPLVEVLWRSRFIRVTAIEFLKLMGTAYKVPYRVPCRV